MNRTHGGLPETEALHWNDETRQQLGQIVFLFVDGSKERARQGYIKFYQLKRLFIAIEFDEFVERLDRHREAKGFPSLTSMVRRVGEQMVAMGEPVDIDAQPVGPIDVPATAPVVEPCRTAPVTVEQMSLFG